ncbi:type IV pilus biogenesis/stability protein PilW [Lysobacter solisilvae (ex Woo and Kim 2020)]|uniref:Type IV pilus biogenesis/stability protein PilW n=1 Tax=Agrilutibacter terrestris TaxID=2865112 RepID=A0A7H0FX89_9GAMM|nr:type IV pilus biogenesis/stability protein PilW [Lysobacter terrestris]QNP40655.1 type IV pilus biogenesis/stability protein PilW [Lysobacter terrestris]
MPLRNAILFAVVAIAAAASGCGGGSYVSTSLGREHHVEPAVNRVLDSKGKKARETEAGVQRDLAEIPGYLAAGDFAAAKKAAASVLKREPQSVVAHTYLAVALEHGGDAAGAGSHYLRAAELSPTNGAALGNYGIWLCGQGRTAESLAWFDKALEQPGQQGTALTLANAGVCAGKVGQQQRAERDLRRAIELDPENPVALAALAEREFQAGDAFEARAFSERRLAAAPADPKTLLLASQIEQKLGDSSAAARYVSRLKAEFPDAPEARSSAMGDGGRQ